MPSSTKLCGLHQAKTGPGTDSRTRCTVATGMLVRAMFSIRRGGATFQDGQMLLRLVNSLARSPAYCSTGGRAACRCSGSAAAVSLTESFPVTGCTLGPGGVVRPPGRRDGCECPIEGVALSVASGCGHGQTGGGTQSGQGADGPAMDFGHKDDGCVDGTDPRSSIG